jgi:hypothetical protein
MAVPVTVIVGFIRPVNCPIQTLCLETWHVLVPADVKGLGGIIGSLQLYLFKFLGFIYHKASVLRI